MTPNNFRYKFGHKSYLESLKATGMLIGFAPSLFVGIPQHVWHRYHEIHRELKVEPTPFKDFGYIAGLTVAMWVTCHLLYPIAGLFGLVRNSESKK